MVRKILILTNSTGGLYNFRIELIEKLISVGYEVYFSVPESIENAKVKSIIKTGANHIQTSINRRGMNPLQELSLIKKYITIIKEVNPDLILTYTIKPNIYGTYVASRYGKSVIMNITGIGTSLNNNGNLAKLVKKLYKYACDRASFIFFQNESNYLFFTSNGIVNQSKTKIIPGSGVNINRFYPLKKEKQDQILRFLSIGRIMKEKGIEEYLQSAHNLTKKYTNVEFQILGGFEEEKYKKVIRNIKNQRVKYLGTSIDVRNQIKEVDCIVNPSYHEGMSNVLLEGAAMGKPLIASNIPGCREIIADKYNGYLFQPKAVTSLTEKLIRFIELSNEEKERMGENSRKKVVAEFDRTIVIDEYMKVINNLLNKG